MIDPKNKCNISFTSCHSSSGLVFFLPLVLAIVVHSSPALKKLIKVWFYKFLGIKVTKV